ncbi:MAG: hypothetical protein Ct9H300mP16_09670 [Pseudomonadota bacterium]|nr:MAG: hypothetical protein Ct9H300mP16_09670 [Pseudomonadota bacterium]
MSNELFRSLLHRRCFRRCTGINIGACRKNLYIHWNRRTNRGVFCSGNSVCRMVHREAAEGRKSGRKHGIRCAAHRLVDRTTTLVRLARASSNSVLHSLTGSSMRATAQVNGKVKSRINCVQYSLYIQNRFISSSGKTRGSTPGLTLRVSGSTSVIRDLASVALWKC